jgi:hypothetical protein
MATPTNTPTPTPLPAENTPGKVTGGGTIGGKKASAPSTFGFAISYQAGDPAPAGNLSYVDHNVRLSLLATSFDHLVIEGSHARFSGTAILIFTYQQDSLLNRIRARTRFTGPAVTTKIQSVPFEVQVDDLGEPGKADTFTINVRAPNGYSAGGVLTGGNITIHALVPQTRTMPATWVFRFVRSFLSGYFTP